MFRIHGAEDEITDSLSKWNGAGGVDCDFTFAVPYAEWGVSGKIRVRFCSVGTKFLPEIEFRASGEIPKPASEKPQILYEHLPAEDLSLHRRLKPGAVDLSFLATCREAARRKVGRARPSLPNHPFQDRALLMDLFLRCNRGRVRTGLLVPPVETREVTRFPCLAKSRSTQTPVWADFALSRRAGRAKDRRPTDDPRTSSRYRCCRSQGPA